MRGVRAGTAIDTFPREGGRDTHRRTFPVVRIEAREQGLGRFLNFATSARLHYPLAMNAADALSRLTAIAPAIKAMGATSLYLFGSTARGEAGPQSDLDLFIDYDPNSRFNALHLVGIKQFLEDELHTPIDITTRDGLHPMLRSKIERASVRVF